MVKSRQMSNSTNRSNIIVLWFLIFSFSLVESQQRNCSKYQWKCTNGQCIEGHQLCDGTVDCRDQSDETVASCSYSICRSFEFRCTYGACVAGTAECNGERDCADNSDEQTLLCPGVHPDTDLSGNCTTHFQYQCDSGQCISSADLCDGVVNCADGSDETNTRCSHQYCPSYTFRCDYGGCIQGDLKCDRHVDCVDGSDESPALCGYDLATTAKPIIPPPVTGSCVVPESPENGRIVYAADPTMNLVQGQPIGEGEPIEYKCFNKYSLVGNSMNYCFEGMWIDKTPKCRKYCDHFPLNKISIKASCNYNNTGVSCKQPLPPGTRVTINCRIGYRQPDRQLPDVIICDESGEWHSYPWKCEEVCGVPTPDQIPFIVGGQQTDIRKVPWHAGIYIKTSATGWDFQCGGSIISSRIVVSAAHCFWNRFFQEFYAASEFLITAGKTYRGLNATETEVSQSFLVDKLITKQEYLDEDGLFNQDIAVVILTDFIIFRPYILPVCVDFKVFGNDRYIQSGIQGQVSGWGKTDPNGGLSDVLKVLTVPTVDYATCKNESPPAYQKFITGDKFCAGHRTGQSVCQGDSGGGLVFPRDIAGTPTYYLHGVVSSGPSKEGSCDNTRYTVFTDIQIYINMIRDAYVMYLAQV